MLKESIGEAASHRIDSSINSYKAPHTVAPELMAGGQEERTPTLNLPLPTLNLLKMFSFGLSVTQFSSSHARTHMGRARQAAIEKTALKQHSAMAVSIVQLLETSTLARRQTTRLVD